IRAAYATPKSTGGGWDITLNTVNTGSSDITVTLVLINGKPASIYNKTGEQTINLRWGTLGIRSPPISILTGKSQDITIEISGSKITDFIAGQTIEVALVSATGTNYPKAIVLP
ncbi:MAG: hypothetical protein RMJ31_07505, partial [Nitrososphaerota archaeon]|nr:hypothetical protein [Nitrososphaerota archaeon]